MLLIALLACIDGVTDDEKDTQSPGDTSVEDTGPWEDVVMGTGRDGDYVVFVECVDDVSHYWYEASRAAEEAYLTLEDNVANGGEYYIEEHQFDPYSFDLYLTYADEEDGYVPNVSTRFRRGKFCEYERTPATSGLVTFCVRQLDHGLDCVTQQ